MLEEGITAGVFESEPAIEVERAARDALICLMSEHEHALSNYLLVLLSDREAVNDTLQDTFLRAYEHLRKGKPVTTRWLYTVARNRAMDHFRARGKEQREPEELGHAVEEEWEESWATAAARRALAQLSPSDREILYLFTVDKLPTAEIASMLGIRPTALRVRLYRARERFRAIYGEDAR